MILNDTQIIQRMQKEPGNEDWALCINPFDASKQLQPASVDLRLGWEFKKPLPNAKSYLSGTSADYILDPRKEIAYEDLVVAAPMVDHNLTLTEMKSAISLAPGEFLLGTTAEWVEIPHDLVARVEGRSSIGRMGITVHVTAGFIDPGFRGNITLEIANLSGYTVLLYPGMRICQLCFHRMADKSANPYQGKYQGQIGTTGSRIDQDYREEE